ncbi:MAG: vWA domain-containing protein [Gemmataceae bacterium]
MPCRSRFAFPVSLTAGPAVAFLLVALCPAAPAPAPKKPTVEVVFVIDTTGSMSGLIDAAKLKAWSICNQILNGRPMPTLKVGLVAFRDKQDDYVTKVADLREDLDEIYAELQTYSANGGGDTPEHVNQALDDAVNKISWSRDSRTLKIIFLVGDAPPHMDYNDDVKYPISCSRAMERGILINAIQCGSDPECTKFWKDIAEKGGGGFAVIPQGGGVRGVSTPFDRRLADINAELTRGTIVYGDARKRDADAKKVQAALALPSEIAADRAGYLAKEGKVARYDLLDMARSGVVDLDKVRADDLPEALRRMSPKERREHLEKVGQARAKLLREAHDLDRHRSATITKELERNKDSFDSQVLNMLRKQAARRVRY